MSAFCMKLGLIPNIFEREGNEKQVYEQRFGIFASMQFPRYITYEEYRANLDKDMNMDQKELLDKAKALFIEGKNILQKLIDTDESLRNGKYYKKEYLQQVQRIAVMNSLSLTKASMFGAEALFKINKAESLPTILLVDIEKKK